MGHQMRFFEKAGLGVRLPQLRRKTEFYLFEVLSLAFGASLAQFFFVHDWRWQNFAICALGYVASFCAMVSIRCIHCREPLGRVNGKWSAFADDSCSKCGRDHG
jgi:hypothetical protein